MMQVRRGRWSIKIVQDDGGKSSVGICDEDGEVVVVLILILGVDGALALVGDGYWMELKKAGTVTE